MSVNVPVYNNKNGGVELSEKPLKRYFSVNPMGKGQELSVLCSCGRNVDIEPKTLVEDKQIKETKSEYPCSGCQKPITVKNTVNDEVFNVDPTMPRFYIGKFGFGKKHLTPIVRFQQ